MAQDDWDSVPKHSSSETKEQQNKLGLPNSQLVILSSLTESILHLLKEFQSQLNVAMEQAQPEVSKSSASHIDEAIHVVELLFNVLFYETDISQDIKLLMARLQMIYVKIASSDDRFYRDSHHPARAVLTQLIKNAKASATPEEHQEIKKTVEYLIAHHDSDPAVFETILSHFRKSVPLDAASIAWLKQRTNAAGVRDLDHTVKAYIYSTLQSGSVQMLPEAAKNFIKDPLQAILYKIAMGEGINSDPWNSTLKTLREFVSTFKPNYDFSSEEAQGKQQELKETLKASLDTIDMSTEEKSYWMDLIQGCWHTQKEKTSSSVIKIHQDNKAADSQPATSPKEVADQSKADETSGSNQEEETEQDEIEEIELTAPSPFGKY